MIEEILNNCIFQWKYHFIIFHSLYICMYSFSLQGVSINLGYNYYVIEVLVYSLLNVNCNDINWLNVKILTYYSLISALVSLAWKKILKTHFAEQNKIFFLLTFVLIQLNYTCIDLHFKKNYSTQNSIRLCTALSVAYSHT